MSESDDRRDDQALQEYLEGRSPLSARYRAISAERAPPSLDDAVLRAARAALPRPAPPRRSWQQRWAVPVGIAATLVVGLDLGWRVRDSVRTEQAAADQAVVELARAPESAPAVSGLQPAGTPVPEPEAASLAGTVAATSEPEPTASRTPAVPAATPEADAQPPAAMPVNGPAAESAPVEDAVPESFDEAPSAEASAAAEAPADRGEESAAGDTASPPEARVSEARQAAARASMDQAMQRRKSEARRQMVQTLAAPPAPVEPPPPPRSAEEAQAAAEDLADLLRREQDEVLQERFSARLPRQALRDAATVMAPGLTPRLSAEDDGRWRVDYLDARQQTRCTARLRPTTEGWVLEGLVTRP